MKAQRKPLVVANLKTLEDCAVNHARVLNGQVSFGATLKNNELDRNIFCSKASGTTPGVANTEFSVTHGLKRIPITFFGHTDNGGVLYKSTTAWSSTTIFLKCTTATANYATVIL